ncbi:MAG: Mur ligase domain-containing protein [Planctomycetaceae bacterium]
MTHLQLSSVTTSSFMPGNSSQINVNKALKSISKVHLVGICGSGMKALAEYLSDCGIEVSGSDQSHTGPLWHTMQQRGWKIHHGHRGEYLPKDVELLVYSPAISDRNPERVSAQELGIAQLSYTELLGKLLEHETGFCISGTHGKSTTTAMLGSILKDSRQNPSLFVGAELCGRNRSGWAGGGEIMVVESCEYRRHFLNYKPKFAAILGIEADHFDCYANVEEATQAYAEFARNVSPEGVLLIAAESEATAKAAAAASAKVVTFSSVASADWWATDVRQTPTGQRFRVFLKGNSSRRSKSIFPVNTTSPMPWQPQHWLITPVAHRCRFESPSLDLRGSSGDSSMLVPIAG